MARHQLALLVTNFPAVMLKYSQLIKAKMAELEQKFSAGIERAVGLDRNTLFVAASLEEAFKNPNAIALVSLVIFVFYRIGAPRSFPLRHIPVSSSWSNGVCLRVG